MAGNIQKTIKYARALLRKWVMNDDGSLRFWTVPVVLLIVNILSFGLYAKQQGFYWDDWGFSWAYYFRGLQGLIDTFSSTRPIRAYIDYGLMRVFGIHPFTWQIIAILMRWLAAVTLWWLLGQIWPKCVRPVFVVTLLFLIYPGFSQQAVAITYYYFWLLQVMLFLSFGLMVFAVRQKRYFWLALVVALLLSLLQLFSSEHFIGIEFLRPFILWMALRESIPDFKKRLGRTALYYFPFAAILALFLSWRFFIFKFPGYQPELLGSLQSSFTQGLIGLLQTILQTLVTVSLQAWSKTIQIPVVLEGGKLFLIAYPMILIFCLVGLVIYQDRLGGSQNGKLEKTNRNYVWQFLGIGIIALLFAGLPYYFAGLPVWVIFPEDRFTLAFALSVSFLITGLVELLLKTPYRITLVSAMAAFAIGLNFYTGFLFRNENSLQNTFLWQLTWRAPALRQNTVILSGDQTFKYTDDEGLTYAINWMYAPENHDRQIPYLYFDIVSRYKNGLPSTEKSVVIQKDFTEAYFQGSSEQVLVIYFAPPSCLRVLDPIYDADMVSLPVTWDIAGQPTIQSVRLLPRLTRQALPLSDTNSILVDSEQVVEPPSFLYPSEPKHNWCYLFEKADLARQAGNWDEVARLGDEAAVNFYYPADLSEYLVFIEAYTHVSRMQEARSYSEKIAGWAPILTPALCGIWQRADKITNLSDGDRDLISTVKQELRCPIP